MILETLKYLVENPQIAAYLVVVLAAQMELLRRDVKKNVEIAASIGTDLKGLRKEVKTMREELEGIDRRLIVVEQTLLPTSPG